MLRNAHKVMEAMSAGVGAIKDESWDEAAQSLGEAQRLLIDILQELANKKSGVPPPKPDGQDNE